MSSARDISETRLIVFYDGECAFCNKQVQLALKWDKQQRLAFAPLQGKTARELQARHPEFEPQPGKGFASMVAYRPPAPPQLRSSAVLAVMAELGGIWKVLAALGRLIPRPLRDALYDFIARNRYVFMGRREPGEQCLWQPGIDPARFLE